MGSDIHSYAERKNDDGSWEAIPELAPFGDRHYGVFGWLADVRNFSAVPPIAKPRGMPEDATKEAAEEYESVGGDAHSASWLTVAELLAFNYDASYEDFWPEGAVMHTPDQGTRRTFRELLGARFFEDLDSLRNAGAERVVFWFDN